MTAHSIIRTQERAFLRKDQAIRFILLAKVRGKEKTAFHSNERKYIERKEKSGQRILVYNGFCFVFDDSFEKCITMYALPEWFGKKKYYDGKTSIRNPKKYVFNYIIQEEMIYE